MFDKRVCSFFLFKHFFKIFFESIKRKFVHIYIVRCVFKQFRETNIDIYFKRKFSFIRIINVTQGNSKIINY